MNSINKKLYINNNIEFSIQRSNVLVFDGKKIYKLVGQQVRNILIPLLPELERGIKISEIYCKYGEEASEEIIKPLLKNKWIVSNLDYDNNKKIKDIEKIIL
nr:hypothetical protein [uncultured Ligilactobacillus sp.]